MRVALLLLLLPAWAAPAAAELLPSVTAKPTTEKAELEQASWTARSKQADPDRVELPFEIEATLAPGDATLSDDSFYDSYSFEGKAGQIVTFALTSEEFNTFLLLKNESGESLDENDDFGGGTDSFVAIELPQDGVYRVLASVYSAGLEGRYQLQGQLGDETDLKRVEAHRLNQQGVAAYNRSDYSEALSLFEEALAIRQEIGDRSGEGTTLNNIGSIHKSQGDYGQALVYYEQALVIRQEIGDRNGEFTTLSNISLIYDSQGDYGQALNYAKQALAVSQEIDDCGCKGTILSYIGNIYFRQGNYSQALDYYQQALAIGISNRSVEGITLNRIGIVYHILGNYSQALYYYQQALTVSEDIGNRSDEGAILNYIGDIYFRQGNYSQALDYYQQTLAVSQEIDDPSGVGTALGNIGRIYTSLGDYSQALDYSQQALVILQEIGDRSGVGTALGNIGDIYSRQGNYGQAFNYFQQALTISREIDNRSGMGTALGNIGHIYTSLGDYSQALDYSQQALVILQEIGDRSGVGTALGNIGDIYFRQGNYGQAFNYFQQALTISQEIDDRSGVGTSLNSIGAIYSRQRNYGQALDYYQQALAILQEIGNCRCESTILNNIGFIYSNQGNSSQALDYHQQALSVSQEVGDLSGESQSLNNIGDVLSNQQQPELAIVFLKQSVNTYETIRGDIRSLDSSLQSTYTETVSDTYRTLADLLLQQDRILEAQRVLDLLKVQELEDYLREVRGGEQPLVVLQAEQEILAAYNELQTTAGQLGQELAELRQIPEASRTEAQVQRIAQLVDLQEAINKEFRAFATSPEVRQLIGQLSYEAREATINPAQLDSLRDDLAQLNAVLLYPLVLEDRLELVITTPNSPPLRRTVNVSRVELNQAILDFRLALEDPAADAVTPAQKLYDWLVRPLESDLEGTETIIYAPDGKLRYVPLAALHDGSQWLVESYQVNNITVQSLTDLDHQPATDPRILAAAFADTSTTHTVVVGSSEFPLAGLPFAGSEVNFMETNLADITKFLDQGFNLDAVKSVMNEYNILHFATHAAFVPEAPEYSFILFGSGEAPNLIDIGGWSLNNVDLVVLSACETGLGNAIATDGSGEEILGLGYQFQLSGARSVMASLWQVNDNSTQILMTAFYTALNNGYSKAEALSLAQQALITSDLTLVGPSRGASLQVLDTETGEPMLQAGNLSHPYYWAPFILIGNGL